MYEANLTKILVENVIKNLGEKGKFDQQESFENKSSRENCRVCETSSLLPRSVKEQQFYVHRAFVWFSEAAAAA